MGTKYLDMYILLVYRLILELQRGYSLLNCVQFIPLYVLCVLLLLFFACFSFFWDFVGISSANPHETSLVHLGKPSGLKGLLHTLNAIVIPTKVS